MAVFGYLDDIVKNLPLNKAIMDGIGYLKGLTPESFSEVKQGKPQTVAIDGDTLFAVNQMYRTKPKDLAKFEGHQRYVDLQYIYEGFETIQNGSITDCLNQSDYDAENDVQFFTSEFFSSISLKKNMLCILYPDDIHAPGLVFDGEAVVIKSVVKVLI
jgi:biofilm protein TabA